MCKMVRGLAATARHSVVCYFVYTTRATLIVLRQTSRAKRMRSDRSITFKNKPLTAAYSRVDTDMRVPDGQTDRRTDHTTATFVAIAGVIILL